jgi:hypothetical protein
LRRFRRAGRIWAIAASRSARFWMAFAAFSLSTTSLSGVSGRSQTLNAAARRPLLSE